MYLYLSCYTKAHYELITPPENYSFSKSTLFRNSTSGYKQIPFKVEIPIIIKSTHEIEGFHLTTAQQTQKVSLIYAWDNINDKNCEFILNLTWKNVESDVKSFRTTCEMCFKNKFLTTAKHLKSMPYPIISKKPLDRVQIDLVKVPKLYSKKILYLMTCKDHFSRYATVYFLINKCSKSISICLENLLNNWGKPKIIQTDNGTEFFGEFDAILQ